MDEILLEISKIAKELRDSGETDLDICKMSVIFPLFEYLGYDTTSVGDIQTAPYYTVDVSYKIDYGLRDLDPDRFKTLVKVVPVGEEITVDDSRLRSCVLQAESVQYIIVTDCFRFHIYTYDSPQNVFIDVDSFDICDEDSIKPEVLQILENPASDIRTKQQYADYGDEDEEEEYMGYTEGAIKKYVPEEAHEEPEPPQKTKVKWGFILLAQLLAIGIIVAIVLLLRNPNSNVLNFFNPNSQNNLDYYDISSTLDLSLDKANHALKLEFYSRDIPQGGKVKFQIVNGEDSAIVYGDTSSSGKISGSYTIPDTWKDPKITVTAYLRFDEIERQQPQNVREKFGEIGEKIVGKENAPDKFALTFSSIDYDSAAVQEYLLWLRQQEEANLRAERLADFNGFEFRYDSLGNIKVLPKGYDMNKVGITGNIHVYPQIFYDANTNFAHMYLVCGQISSVTWSMFRSVSFYADGMAWSYDIGNNEKKQQVTGQYITEWVYFDNYNIATLPSETALLGAAEVSQVIFNGSKPATYTLSSDEKANINAAVALYNKYFADSSNPPSTTWFEESSSVDNPQNTSRDDNNYSLSYIYTPSVIYERDASEQNRVNTLEENIEAAKSNGGASLTQLQAYEIESNKYRVLDDEFRDILMNELNNTYAMLVYEQDYEYLNMDYCKLYFHYENPRSIENGYIPHMYIMENRTVYLPVKTSTGATIREKSYASFILSPETYNALMNALDRSPYQQVGSTANINVNTSQEITADINPGSFDFQD